MDGTNFWLIYIQDDHVIVSLINQTNQQYRVLSTGPTINWDIESEDSLVKAVDESLSTASLNGHISEDDEPELTAFVVPPFWVDNDGRISSPKLKLIKGICKSLNLQPSGFLSEDEAIVEEANQKDDFPASFILVHLSKNDFYISLVYLGHIKERIRHQLNQPFNGRLLESAILELNSKSALPPQIIMFGNQAKDYLDEIKNFAWIGKKDIETFLHFPEVTLYQDNDIINIFSKVVISQSKSNQPSNDENEPETISEIEEVTSSEASFEEVEAADLGFSSETKTFTEDKIEDQTLPFAENISIPVQDLDIPKKNKKIKFPKLKLNLKNRLVYFVLLALSLSLIFIIFFSKTTITLSVMPFDFNKQVKVTLSTDASTNDISSSIIPVTKKSFDIQANSQIPTTGEKTIGDKAKGEIIIYNKLDKSQSLPGGSVLVDPSGKKFELVNSVSVASSSSNLSEGIITLGQTKTSIVALEIGSEYNLEKDVQLKFEKLPDTSIIARVGQSLSGGSKQQIRAVSSQDRSDIEDKIDQEITDKIENEGTNEANNVSGIISGTTQISKGKIELSREVGEAAEELTAKVDASVSVLTIDDSTKEKILHQFLSDQSNFADSEIKVSNFNLSFVPDDSENVDGVGSLSIIGKADPKIDINNLKKSLLGKTNQKASLVIRKIVSRAYNFNIKNNFPFNFLPLRESNLSIEINQ